MKFPKSMHAEGWDNHFETTDKAVSSAPLHAAKAPATGPARFKPSGAGAKISVNQPLNADAPRVDPLYVRAEPTVASVERDRQMSWMIPAGAGAAIIAAVAIWAVNRPSTAPVTPPAIVVGSAEPQAEVAAATPAPETPAVAQAEDSATTTVAAAPTTRTPTPAVEPAPARLGPPVTTSRPAVEPRPAVVAQAPAPVPSPRPEMVLRAQPSTPVATLPPPTTVAAAPVDAQPLSVSPGSAPIVMPPTSAGPSTSTMPLASATPDTSASSAATGTPPLAQAQAMPQVQAQAQPAPLAPVEDSGITVKVRTALASDPTLAAVPIAVSTDHGVVKLEGQAPDSQTRERATVVASSATGVKAVDNRLTLPPATVVSQAPTSLQ